MNLLGVDIGGTGAKLALVEAGGAILQRRRFETGPALSGEALVDRLAGLIAELDPGGSLTSVGVAAPGCRRADGEGVVNVTNLPHLDGFPLRASLASACGREVWVENDANAAALGEYEFGGHSDVERMLVVTVGTGIGAGMVVAGRIHRIAWEGLGDPGHVVVAPGGRRCACGARGCVEAMSAVPAIEQAAGADAPCLLTAVQRARSGDARARGAFDEAGRLLGVALATLTHLLAPQLILLGGGGMDVAADLLLPPVRESLAEHIQPFFGERLRLERAVLGNDAGVLGAAALSQARVSA